MSSPSTAPHHPVCHAPARGQQCEEVLLSPGAKQGALPSISSVLPRLPVPGAVPGRGEWAEVVWLWAGVVWLCCSAAPAMGTPSYPLSAGRSLDRLDSVEILLPPKFPTWEEEYNQISDSVNESSCINQVRC